MEDRCWFDQELRSLFVQSSENIHKKGYSLSHKGGKAR
jgi:hypothetical protein